MLKNLLLLLFVGSFFEIKAQFTINEIQSMELGEKFADVEQLLNTKFGGNIESFEGNVQNLYKIESPVKDSSWILKKHLPYFDRLGDCQYVFKFVNDALVGVDIRFQFIAIDSKKENFEILLRSIDSLFSNEKGFFPLKSAAGSEAFNIDAMVNRVKTNCDAEAANGEYGKQSAVLGTKAWEVHKRVNNIPRHKLMTLQVYTAAMRSEAYSGCMAIVELTVSNEEFIGLYNKMSEMKIKYESLSDE